VSAFAAFTVALSVWAWLGGDTHHVCKAGLVGWLIVGLSNAEAQEVQSHTQPKPCDVLLTNLTAVNVLRQGGQVVVLPRFKVLHGVLMVARLRY
jgi:hypothetical protein